MKQPTRHLWILPAAALLLSPPLHGQTKDAPLSPDSTSKSCLQLKDDNTWASSLSELSGVGTLTTLAQLLAAGLPDLGVQIFAPGTPNQTSLAPPVVGYHSGMRWDDTDMATKDWTPQGLTTGSSGNTDFAIVSWHYNSQTVNGVTVDNGSRVSIVNTTDLSQPTYRNIILVHPTGNQTYEPVSLHVGGLALEGNYLYVADTSHGFRVFDLNQLRQVDNSDTTCVASNGQGNFGKVGSNWCANGYSYMLPQVGSYTMPPNKSDGTPISPGCRPKFSWAGKDTRPATPLVLSGEFCAQYIDNTPANVARQCQGETTGLLGRLYQWPVGSDGKLITSSLYVSPTQVYQLNERNAQGVGPDTVSGAPANSYWLASSRNNGVLYKVSPTTTAQQWVYAPPASQMPFAPEGLHSTVSSGHLWMVTEGEPGVTDPSAGGRILISLDQANIQ